MQICSQGRITKRGCTKQLLCFGSSVRSSQGPLMGRTPSRDTAVGFPKITVSVVCWRDSPSSGSGHTGRHGSSQGRHEHKQTRPRVQKKRPGVNFCSRLPRSHTDHRELLQKTLQGTCEVLRTRAARGPWCAAWSHRHLFPVTKGLYLP